MGKNSLSIDEIIEYYNTKYDDEFTYVSSDNELWNADYSEIILKSSKLDNRVVIWVYPDGTMLDNYMPIKYREDVEALVQPMIEEIYGKCLVVNVPLRYGRKHFSKDMDLVQYVSDKRSSVSISIATNKSSLDGEQDIEKLISIFKNNNIIANIDVFYYQISDISEVSRTNKDTTIFEPEADKLLSVTVNTDYTIGVINWSE